ncbi:unannotated protein [freshwater metagenome]|uniref:Unannotated protein n=1 Tax=freshwater metagenome TaxID=449393 RepID=A0A6J6SR30_9ZZZZ
MKPFNAQAWPRAQVLSPVRPCPGIGPMSAPVFGLKAIRWKVDPSGRTKSRASVSMCSVPRYTSSSPSGPPIAWPASMSRGAFMAESMIKPHLPPYSLDFSARILGFQRCERVRAAVILASA